MRSFAEAKKGIKFLQHMPRALSEGADDLVGEGYLCRGGRGGCFTRK